MYTRPQGKKTEFESLIWRVALLLYFKLYKFHPGNTSLGAREREGKELGEGGDGEPCARGFQHFIPLLLYLMPHLGNCFFFKLRVWKLLSVRAEKTAKLI